MDRVINLLIFAVILSLILSPGCAHQSTKPQAETTTVPEENPVPTESPIATTTTLTSSNGFNSSINDSEAKSTTTTLPGDVSKMINLAIKNFEYSEVALRIRKGDTIVWTNLDTVAHTVSSDTGGELDSDTLVRGETFMHTFNSRGVFGYHCKMHPSMKGKVIVS